MFKERDLDQYFSQLVREEFIPLFNFLITVVPTFLSLVFGILTATRFIKMYSFSGSTGFDIVEKAKAVRSVITALLLTGIFSGLASFINLSSNTFFTRRNNSIRISQSGFSTNLNSFEDAAFTVLAGIGIVAFIAAGLRLDRAARGDREAGGEVPNAFFAGMLLVNAETSYEYFLNTFDISF